MTHIEAVSTCTHNISKKDPPTKNTSRSVREEDANNAIITSSTQISAHLRNIDREMKIQDCSSRTDDNSNSEAGDWDFEEESLLSSVGIEDIKASSFPQNDDCATLLKKNSSKHEIISMHNKLTSHLNPLASTNTHSSATVNLNNKTVLLTPLLERDSRKMRDNNPYSSSSAIENEESSKVLKSTREVYSSTPYCNPSLIKCDNASGSVGKVVDTIYPIKSDACSASINCSGSSTSCWSFEDGEVFNNVSELEDIQKGKKPVADCDRTCHTHKLTHDILSVKDDVDVDVGNDDDDDDDDDGWDFDL